MDAVDQPCGFTRGVAEPLDHVIVQIMVSIKEAAASATVFAREALGPERTTGVRLEEVESTTVTGQGAWLITLSMIIPSSGSIVAALSDTGKREYESFMVLKSNGEVKSMKIRELANA
jgi:hypothetical protein